MLPCHRETSMIGFQLIPARGRKHDILTLLDVRLMDFNLSPQGDGNSSGWSLRLTLLISTYPRKGTETMHLRT